jgi:hypothetical protein
MEAKASAIPVEAVRESNEGSNLGQAIMARFGELGGVELDLPSRNEMPRAAEFADEDSRETGEDVIGTR